MQKLTESLNDFGGDTGLIVLDGELNYGALPLTEIVYELLQAVRQLFDSIVQVLNL